MRLTTILGLLLIPLLFISQDIVSSIDQILPDKEFENINFLEMDSYNQEGWPTDVLKDVSVVFIDAVHEYYPVISDINNAVKLNAKHIVFGWN